MSDLTITAYMCPTSDCKGLEYDNSLICISKKLSDPGYQISTPKYNDSVVYDNYTPDNWEDTVPWETVTDYYIDNNEMHDNSAPAGAICIYSFGLGGAGVFRKCKKYEVLVKVPMMPPKVPAGTESYSSLVFEKSNSLYYDDVLRIKVSILKESDDRHICKYPDALSWKVQHTQHKEQGEIVVGQDYKDKIVFDKSERIWINLTNPDTCDWIASTIMTNFRSILIAYVGSGQEGKIPIPEDKSKVRVAVPAMSEIRNDLVPGEEITARWFFKRADDFVLPESPLPGVPVFPGNVGEVVGVSFYRTHCFTGGKVMEVMGGYGSPFLSYAVETEGKLIIARASDHAKYYVGDWVYLLTMGGQCSQCERPPLNPCYKCESTPDHQCTEEYENCKGGGNSKSTMTEGAAEELLRLVNELRTSYGVPKLTLNKALSAAAEMHVADMANNCFIGHAGSNGLYHDSRVVTSGYCTNDENCTSGENCAVICSEGPQCSAIQEGSSPAEQAYISWLHSPPHKANMIHPDFKEMGCASAMFADRCERIKDTWHPGAPDTEIITYDVIENSHHVQRKYKYEGWVQVFGAKSSPPIVSNVQAIIVPFEINMI